MKKFLCECGKLATWHYMPSTSVPSYNYFCEDCVPRGCSCNEEYTVKSQQAHENGYGEDPPTDHNQWKWIDKDICWAYTDDKGRELPCIEFCHSNDGYEPYDGKPDKYSPDGCESELSCMDRNNVKYYLTES